MRDRRESIIFLWEATRKAQDEITWWKKGKGRRLEVCGLIVPFSYGDVLIGANRVRDFCCLAPEKRSGGRERADGHISPPPPQATWSIPHVTHSRALERRRRGPREWGWGWEDGLTVNPAQRHLVSYQEAGCELREGRGHECVRRVSWWFMASSRVLCESCSWPRRPTETVSEIKSPWRYVLEIALSQLECGSEDTIPSLSLIFFRAIWRFYGLKCSLGALDLLQVQKDA